MKIVFLFYILFLTIECFPQTTYPIWHPDYVTCDDPFSCNNYTGYNTISVGVLREDVFVGLVCRRSNNTNYIIGYRNADSINGRLGNYSYGTAIVGTKSKWHYNGSEIFLKNAMDLAITSDSLIFIPNNNINRDILVFYFGADSIYSSNMRLQTGVDSLWAIEADSIGHIFVSSFDVATGYSKILVFNGPSLDSSWRTTHTIIPIDQINLPDPGLARGVTSSKDGNIVYISIYDQKRIYKFIGNPGFGYVRDNSFDFYLNEIFIASNGDTLNPRPWGIDFSGTWNKVFVAFSENFKTGSAYEYGRIYGLSGDNGNISDTLDIANWNYYVDSSFVSHITGHASGYASNYKVSIDEKNNIYTQSYYGWTVDKWSFSPNPFGPGVGGGFVPVELSSFTAVQSGDKVILNWSTTSETNNCGFEIERKFYSSSAAKWVTIGFKEGKGTTSEINYYSFTNELEGLSGKISYRLKQIDFDGSYEYLNEIEVEIGVPDKFELYQNYPNPFNPTTIIKYSVPQIINNQSSIINLKIYDVLGNEVATLANEEKPPGVYEVEFNASHLASGMYVYKITVGNPSAGSGQAFIQAKKLLLMK